MIKRETGFSIVELLIIMLIFGFVLAAGSDMFVGVLTNYKQQSKITETSIEGVIGLEMLRRDIESAGYGLPWLIPSGTTYLEAVPAAAAAYNDSPTTGVPATSGAPRAVLSGDAPAAGWNGTDYLVIKAVNAAASDVSQKWTYLKPGNATTVWTPDTENVNVRSDGTVDNTVRVIVIAPGTSDATRRTLATSSTGSFFAQFNNPAGSTAEFSSAAETRIMYGVNPNTNLRMPFNRADYYVAVPASGLPLRCANGTGILYKSILNQGDGNFGTPLPLLDCVADMQVIYRFDMDEDGTVSTTANADGSAISTSEGATIATVQSTMSSAATLRTRLKEVRVYLLAQEGQREKNSVRSTNTILVGESSVLGRNFDLTAITDWQRYRWKVYTLVVRPNNLR